VQRNHIAEALAYRHRMASRAPVPARN
jgi:hypothetical protein